MIDGICQLQNRPYEIEQGGKMTVTFGEKKGKKTSVYVDGSFIGSLYPKAINEYDLTDEGDISEETLNMLMEETLLRRAKCYVMNLLVKADKTENELKRKLKENGYSDETSTLAIEYVRSFHYIDELRTAENYVRTKMDNLSEREIRYKLSEKGIDDETIDTAYEQILESIDPERNTEGTSAIEIKAAENFLRKKLGIRSEISYEDKQKIMAAAYRKGFRQESIRSALKNLIGDS